MKDTMIKSSHTVKQLRSLLSRAKNEAELASLMDVIISDKTSPSRHGILLDFATWYKWRLKASSFTEKQWLAFLAPIKDKQVRAKVASILWWDHASHCPKLFPLMLQYHRGEDDTEAIYAELIRIGYPEKQASRRCKQPKDSHYRPGEA